MKISREWAMPNKWTFLIPPIDKLVYKYVGDGSGWIDPFAGENSPAEITNDLNPERPTKYHLHARYFANILEGTFKGVLFNPPYSTRQTIDCYDGVGLEFDGKETKECVHWGKIKTVLGDKIELGGIAICCGWNSNGFGIKRGFELLEVLLVAHGGNGHNDTIVTVERKFQNKLL